MPRETIQLPDPNDFAHLFGLSKDEYLALFNCAMLGCAAITGDLRSQAHVSDAAAVALSRLGEERWNRLVDRLDKRASRIWPNIQTTYRRNKE